ncbi:MAG: hypothetical protein V1495_10145 [Pseudomonadota bacterium]
MIRHAPRCFSRRTSTFWGKRGFPNTSSCRVQAIPDLDPEENRGRWAAPLQLLDRVADPLEELSDRLFVPVPVAPTGENQEEENTPGKEVPKHSRIVSESRP